MTNHRRVETHRWFSAGSPLVRVFNSDGKRGTALWKTIFFTSGAQAYTLITGVVVLTLTARWLGPSGRGVIAAVTTWVTLFSTLAFLSLGQVAIHHATTMREREWLGATLGSLLAIVSTITMLCWIAVAVLYWATGGSIFGQISGRFLALGFVSLPWLAWEQYGSSLLLALGKISIYNTAQIIGRTLVILVVGLSWLVGWGIAGVLVATGLAQVVVALVGGRYMYGVAGHSIRPEWSTIRKLLLGGTRLHLNYVGDFLISSASILIINKYLGATDTGHYNVALQLMTVVLVVPQAASMAMYGEVAKSGPVTAWATQRRVVITLLVIVGGIAMLAAAIAPWLIPTLLGARFNPAVPLFQIMLLASLGITLTKTMTAQWIGRGLFVQMSLITLGIGCATFLTNLFLVPRYGAVGAAWAMVIVYALITAVQLWMVRRCERDYTVSRSPICPTAPSPS